MLFREKGVGIDRINKLVTYSASNISRLNNTQIQNIIDYVDDRVHVISKTITNGNDQSHVTFAEMISSVTSQTSRTNSTFDCIYFRNKTLDQYSTLYREFSSENFDYYGITDEKLCPLCKLGHGEEESIEGRYTSESYFIKCEQRKIEGSKLEPVHNCSIGFFWSCYTNLYDQSCYGFVYFCQYFCLLNQNDLYFWWFTLNG
ncbi:uncharacterized protein OCT59_003166 [Rhizophagus irregularis]|uniref:Uncharacterized protein n=1 Tax=Rhizophagus irregularis (strain DAOM 181602 / DAOM 197198 / MUCL 43194) TaxID=747089 RepID=A0A2P4Q4U4_RHIID|nr:hypothetical protein GLOIN_2v1148603 [Rhizophagus irregularis DAOM 181602=DAOM 197198]POG72612.1 hypothetical protein GLOIN_2v1148603 [Rhizophagus irregularis DAOM 181602=DAOM 197198]UZO11606.1 hypothetical protein OCT59_003166 [Rhizophagus irregularis]|eukprot:XP_025179478.1 hypothetical protein GLOIN_2v1148603 [Rhizophagus irregularis DAOM 181602=DAOM 197198]